MELKTIFVEDDGWVHAQFKGWDENDKIQDAMSILELNLEVVPELKNIKPQGFKITFYSAEH